MSVSSVTEKVDQAGLSKDENGVRTYRRVWTVVVTSRSDTVKTALEATGIPRRGQILLADPSAWCRSIDADRTESPYIFTVTATYRSPDPRRNEQATPENQNPLLRPTKYGISTVVDQVPAQSGTYYGKYSTTYAGNYNTAGLIPIGSGVPNQPVVNSAGEVFIPPPFKDVNRLVWSVTRNEASFTANVAATYIDKVNSILWQGAAPHTVKMTAITANSGSETWDEELVAGTIVTHTQSFWEVHYEIHYRPEGWYTDLQDVGTRHLEWQSAGSYYKLAKNKDTGGQDWQTLTRLNGSGGELSPGGSDNAHLPTDIMDWNLRYLFHKEIDFNPLNL